LKKTNFSSITALFLLMVVLFGCSSSTYKTTPSILMNSKVSSLTNKDFAEVGGLKYLDKLKKPEVTINDNWKKIFGDAYWFGEGSTKETPKFIYNHSMVLYVKNLTDKEVQEKIKNAHYTITWQTNDNKTESETHSFGDNLIITH